MKTTVRFLAVVLALALGLPSPALGLRAVGLEESNQQPVLREALDSSPTRQRKTGLEEPRFTPETVRIALVEDNAFQLKALQELVTGYLARSANPLATRIKPDQIGAFPTTKAAIAWIVKEKPQMVITDLNLPDGLGFAVIAAAKRVNPSAGVVLASAPFRTQQAEVDRLLADGTLNHFLWKPFSIPREVYPLVDQHIVQRLAAGMEEDPIAAALTQGPVAVKVDAGGVARINGQGEAITIPDELHQPGFFESGSRTIVVHEEYAALPTFVMLDQIGIKPMTVAGPPWSLDRYVNLARSGITTPPAFLKEVGAWARHPDSIAAVFRTPFLDPAQAQRAAQRFPRLTLVGVPEDQEIAAEHIVALLHAAQLQDRVLYLTRFTSTIFQQRGVLLIAA